MSNLSSWLIAGVLGVALVSLLLVFITFPAYFLWNWLMPSLFGMPSLTFLQTMGLLFLSRMLFGSSVTTKTS